MQPDGLGAMREQMAGLIATFVFTNVEELGLTVDGDRAILHWRADVACKPSGRSGHFEIVDIFTIADGKLYLNYDADVQSKWAKDPAGYIKDADVKFPALLQK